MQWLAVPTPPHTIRLLGSLPPPRTRTLPLFHGQEVSTQPPPSESPQLPSGRGQGHQPQQELTPTRTSVLQVRPDSCPLLLSKFWPARYRCLRLTPVWIISSKPNDHCSLGTHMGGQAMLSSSSRGCRTGGIVGVGLVSDAPRLDAPTYDPRPWPLAVDDACRCLT